MKIANLSFSTDGKTIVVPPTEKAKGAIKVATREDLVKNQEEYMPYCTAYKGGKEERDR